jgi:hypothetical protein
MPASTARRPNCSVTFCMALFIWDRTKSVSWAVEEVLGFGGRMKKIARAEQTRV